MWALETPDELIVQIPFSRERARQMSAGTAEPELNLSNWSVLTGTSLGRSVKCLGG
jgi:hypothetical protein